jgi:hypothetical protein
LEAATEASLAQLRDGVAGYVEMVSAAASLTQPLPQTEILGTGYEVAELTRATERLAGLALAIAELGATR